MKKVYLIALGIAVMFISCKTVDLEKGDDLIEEGTEEAAPEIEEEIEEVPEITEEVTGEKAEGEKEVRQLKAEELSFRVKDEIYEYDVEPFIYEKTKYIVIDREKAEEQKSPTGKEAVKQSLNDSYVTLENFTGGTSYYDYDENHQFPVFTKQLALTTIMLNDDEHMAEGGVPYMSDTERWEITGDVWDSDTGSRQLIMLKPKKSGLETNMMIVTNRRIYHFILYSTQNDYQPMVRFNYPSEKKFITGHTKKVLPSGVTTSYETADPSLLSFNYKIRIPLNSRKEEWIPDRVYDDGSHTYILLPEVVLQKEFPAVWENSRDIVNYEIDPEIHNLIIINKLVNKVTLRIGNKKVVVLKKKGNPKDLSFRR